jgi:hypothetical protein
MNEINRKPLNSLGYDFIPSAYLPKGKDEYYLRNKQVKNGIHYRLTTGTTCWYQMRSILSWCRTVSSLAWCVLVSWNLITSSITTYAAR